MIGNTSKWQTIYRRKVSRTSHGFEQVKVQHSEYYNILFDIYYHKIFTVVLNGEIGTQVNGVAKTISIFQIKERK